MKRISGVLVLACLILISLQCERERPDGPIPDPTPFTLVSPKHLPPLDQSKLIPFTVEGIALGRQLFDDPILSADSTISCRSCHLDEFGLTDGLQFSKGIRNQQVGRNSMPLFNLVYEQKFFWDARAATLVDQIFHPVRDPKEMGSNWIDATKRVMANKGYSKQFATAFKGQSIDSTHIANAIAQFVFTLFSPMTRFDSANVIPGFRLTNDELDGLDLFLGDNNVRPGGDCFHCHDIGNRLFTDHIFRNNGLTAASSITDFPDPGVGGFTKRTEDYGTFKTPSLRMVSKTGPYMHDGRFATLEDVIEHYTSGLKPSININPSELEFVQEGGVTLDAEQKRKLIVFLKTL